MAFLKMLPANATLLDVFRSYPATARPLVEFHEALMHGMSPLSIAEREMIAAFVSGLNACEYCQGIHTVTAEAFGVKEGAPSEQTPNVADDGWPEPRAQDKGDPKDGRQIHGGVFERKTAWSDCPRLDLCL